MQPFTNGNNRMVFSGLDYLNRFFPGWDDPERQLLNTLLVASMVQDITSQTGDDGITAATKDLVDQILMAAFDQRPDLKDYYAQFQQANVGQPPSFDDLNDVHALEHEFHAGLDNDETEADVKKVIRVLTTTTRMPSRPVIGHQINRYIGEAFAVHSVMAIPGLEPFEASLQVLYNALVQLAANYSKNSN